MFTHLMTSLSPLVSSVEFSDGDDAEKIVDVMRKHAKNANVQEQACEKLRILGRDEGRTKYVLRRLCVR